MPGHASKDMKFLVDDIGGTERDITGILDSSDLNQTAEVLDTSVYGEDNTTAISGQRGGTIAGGGRFEVTEDGYLNGILGGDEIDFKFQPMGDATGAVQYAGKAVFSAYNVSTSRGSKVSISFSATLSDTITRSIL